MLVVQNLCYVRTRAAEEKSEEVREGAVSLEGF